MKKLLLFLLPICAFLLGCSDDEEIQNNEGNQLLPIEEVSTIEYGISVDELTKSNGLNSIVSNLKNNNNISNRIVNEVTYPINRRYKGLSDRKNKFELTKTHIICE